jgi:hypothetical protein
MYLKGFSEKQIAESLHVNQSTISRALAARRRENVALFGGVEGENFLQSFLQEEKDRYLDLLQEEWNHYYSVGDNNAKGRSQGLSVIRATLAAMSNMVGRMVAELDTLRMTIDSLECTAFYLFCNSVCTEPVNFAFIQTDGVPAGPPAPDGQNSTSFTRNSKPLMMNPGDDLLVTVKDTSNGLLDQINDLTTSGSGFMTASSANGFANTDVNSCKSAPFNFHPEYSTAAQGHDLSWGSGPNVDFAMEIGHFELGATGDTDGDESPCFTSASPDGISGCTATNSTAGMNRGTDFDGTSYIPDWPEGTANHPHSLVIGAPSDNGVGPMSFDGTTYTASYGTIQFDINQGQRFNTATFYPFYSQAIAVMRVASILAMIFRGS